MSRPYDCPYLVKGYETGHRLVRWHDCVDLLEVEAAFGLFCEQYVSVLVHDMNDCGRVIKEWHSEADRD